MTFGEQLYFGLVVVAFLVFGATLAVVATRTNRHMRGKASATAGHDNDASITRAA